MRSVYRRMVGCAVCGCMLVGIAQHAMAGSQNRAFEWGLGLVFSPDYKDTLDKAYSEYSISGGGGWLDVRAGLRFEINERASVMPGLDLLLNFGSGDVSFTNTILLPCVSLRYALSEDRPLYLRGEVNYGILNMGADRLDADSDGIGFGASLGYARNPVGFEIGYLYIPADVEGFGSQNFGGISLRVVGSF